MFSKSVLNKQQLNKQLNKPRPSELAVPSGEVSYKEYNSGLWPALTWFSAAMAVGLIMGAFFFNVAEAAEGPGGKRYFQIEPKNISMALNEFAMQADSEILFTPDIVEGKQTSGLTGEFTDGEALQKILAGSGLEYKQVDEKVFLVVDPETFEGSAESYKGKSGNDKRVIEEITVTAAKREQSLQDVSISITAIGSEEIARRGLVGMGDYLSSVPGVNALDLAPGSTAIIMRGISAQPDTEGFFGSMVGVYFGEIPIAGLTGQGSYPDIKMVDLERVEVLRGPQGTLYGSSNLGGTVRNIPNAPNLEKFEGRIEAGYSDTGGFGSDNSQFQGVINLPIIDGKLAVRAVGYRFKNSGFYKNIGANDPDVAASVSAFGAVASPEKEGVGNDEYVGGRVSLLWEPTSKLNVNLTYLHQDIEQDGASKSHLFLGEGEFLQTSFQLRRFTTGAPGFGNAEFEESFGDKIKLFNGVIEYDLGWGSVLSSSSWSGDDWKQDDDIGILYFGYVPLARNLRRDTEAFVQELRFASNFEGPFQLIAGLYYEDFEQKFTAFGLFGGEPALNPFGGQIALFGSDQPSTSAVEQKAVYGEASFDLTEKLRLKAGLRAFDFEKGVGTLSDGSSDVTYKAGIDYTPNDDALVYASWTQGFRLGTPISRSTLSVCDMDNDGFFDGSDGVTTGERLLDNDYIDSYEVGAKVSLLDNRLQLDGSIYHVDWEGIPTPVIFDLCGSAINAGDARVRGFEANMLYGLSDAWLIRFGASYVDAELTEDAPGVGVAGDRLPGSPKYNFNLGLQYDFQLNGYNAFFRSDYYHVGSYYNNIKQQGPRFGAFGKLNVRLGILFDSFTVELFSNNITNEEGLSWVESEGAADFRRATYMRPRTVGVNFGYRF